MLSDFFYSGHAADVILVVMVIEFIVLSLGRQVRNRRGATADLAFAMAPGVCLVLALRAALTASDLVWIGAPLAASLPFHLIDLARRRR